MRKVEHCSSIKPDWNDDQIICFCSLQKKKKKTDLEFSFLYNTGWLSIWDFAILDI